MDRSLWLLLRLRGIAFARRWSKNLRSLKGALLGVVGALLFLPLLLSPFFARGIRTGDQLAAIRHYGPFALFAICLFQLLVSAGERAIYYSPAEINFLFSGPYRPRQLLLYKIASSMLPGVLLAGFMTFSSAAHVAWMPAGFLGMFLSIHLLSLSTLLLGLLLSILGTLAFNRLRQVVLAVVAFALLATLASMGRNIQSRGLTTAIDYFLATPVAAVVLLPFRPFVTTFTAERLWPDLILGTGLSLGVLAAMIALILAINAQFLETSVNVSAKLYARIQRQRRGEAVVAPIGKWRFQVPMLPWLGGVGPNLWRQVVTLSRSGQKLLGLSVILGMPLVFVFFLPLNAQAGGAILAPALSMMVSVGLMAPALIGFDFRSDLTRMENLKSLPIHPSALAVGQLVTPVVVLSGFEWAVLGGLCFLAPESAWILGFVALATPSLNFLLVAIDNLYFLWFPFRLTGFNAFDFQAVGRQTLLILAKLFTLVVALGVAGAVGAVPYYVLDGSWIAAALAAWVVLTSFGLALIPLLAHAFVEFDVAEAGFE